MNLSHLKNGKLNERRIMNKADYLKKQILELDDEAFAEITDVMTDRSVDVEIKKNDGIIHISDIKEKIDKVYKNWGKPSGLMSGYPQLDDRVGGFGKGHVILIGGETSNGKSALATNIAVNIARTKPVLYITLEMLQEDVGARIKHINNGTVEDLDLMFQEVYRIDYRDVDPIIKKAKEMTEVQMVVLDYMQYLGRGMKLEEVAKMSKEMKSLALKYEIPFMVIVSIRKAEQGKSKRKWTEIEIEDFMGTGSIGYDCDSAMITSRKNLDGEWDSDGLWVKVLKTRNAGLDYDKRFMRFRWEQTKIIDETFNTQNEIFKD